METGFTLYMYRNPYTSETQIRTFPYIGKTPALMKVHLLPTHNGLQLIPQNNTHILYYKF